jgi:hypothetical protein
LEWRRLDLIFEVFSLDYLVSVGSVGIDFDKNPKVRICATLTDVQILCWGCKLVCRKNGKKFLKNRGFPLSLHKIFKIFCRSLSIPGMEIKVLLQELLKI